MSTTINKPHSVDELSALFDEIDVGSNLDVEKPSDYGSSTKETVRPFDDKVDDVKAIMEHEPPVENTKKITEPEPVVEPKIELELEPVVVVKTKPEPEPKLEVVAESHSENNENPLDLVGVNFQAYKVIQEKYPQFQLYNGSQAYKEFYRYKVQSLKNLLTRYGVLPLDDMKKEIENITLDRRLGTSLADPVVIGERMDESIAGRGRIASLLAKAQIQLPAWKKTFEWLNSKVWKDHESKGAHKRDSLALEHNSDMKDYYSELQGFVDAATTIDNFLKSQHDSYSRQLSCVDIREKVGVAQEAVASDIEKITQPKPSVNTCTPVANSELDGLDTLESGTLIEKVPTGGLIERDFPGAEIESEFLDGIGS